jgi:excisionase family DNA binding protein
MSTEVAHVQHELKRLTRRRERRVGDPQAFVTGGLLTVAEVAGAMRVSNMTVYRLIKSGELPAVRVGKNYRLRESDLERFLQERSVRTEGP